MSVWLNTSMIMFKIDTDSLFMVFIIILNFLKIGNFSF